jgi:hypothetical protein
VTLRQFTKEASRAHTSRVDAKIVGHPGQDVETTLKLKRKRLKDGTRNQALGTGQDMDKRMLDVTAELDSTVGFHLASGKVFKAAIVGRNTWLQTVSTTKLKRSLYHRNNMVALPSRLTALLSSLTALPDKPGLSRN